jgi:hypothetical protein
MSTVERLSLQLTEEQREHFLMLVASNPDTPVFDLFQEAVNIREP